MGLFEDFFNWLESLFSQPSNSAPEPTPAAEQLTQLTTEPTQPDIAPIEPISQTPLFEVQTDLTQLDPISPTQPDTAPAAVQTPAEPTPAPKEVTLTYGYLLKVYEDDYRLMYGGANGTPSAVGTKGIYADGITKARVLYYADEIERQAKGGNIPQPESNWNKAAIQDAETIRSAV
ncbi:MAG: hypothetical protein ACQCN3_00735 [Candidatus Bathyarchaeia archaeon]|jgi:hypothetical protein